MIITIIIILIILMMIIMIMIIMIIVTLMIMIIMTTMMKMMMIIDNDIDLNGNDYDEWWIMNNYTPRFNEVERGLYWFHLVHQSVHPSVHLSVCGQNCVHSVSSTILIRSISYLHILSRNFSRCVPCYVCFKIPKIWNFCEFFKFVILTLPSFDLGSNMTQ